MLIIKKQFSDLSENYEKYRQVLSIEVNKKTKEYIFDLSDGASIATKEYPTPSRTQEFLEQMADNKPHILPL